ncbi:MAG: peptidoglycan DD-metalloendopeptidase family protein [Spirochaetota bacterium]
MIFRKPRKLTHGREIVRTDNFTLIYLGDYNYHYSYKRGKKLFFGGIDLNKKRFQALPLIMIACSLTAILGFSPIQSDKRGQSTLPYAVHVNEVFENDATDRKAKNADEDYLKATEAKKKAILESYQEDFSDTQNDHYKKVTRYTVKKNETLKSIAKRFRLKIQDLLKTNKIKSKYKYYAPGEHLYLPGKAGIIYTFKKGDSLARLVSKYNISTDDVLFENKIRSADLFSPGQKIFLPGAVRPKPPLLWYMPVPSRVITSDFAWRTYPRSHFHDALDLKANYEPVKAARSGKVIYSGWMGGYGNVVIIQHTQGLKTLYAHNSKLYVRRGDRVEGGKVISRSGCTGYCFGAHLHFEIIKNGKTTDPKKYLKGFRYK